MSAVSRRDALRLAATTGGAILGGAVAGCQKGEEPKPPQQGKDVLGVAPKAQELPVPPAAAARESSMPATIRRFNLTKPYHLFGIGEGAEGGYRLGQGIVVDSPGAPRQAGQSPFARKNAAIQGASGSSAGQKLIAVNRTQIALIIDRATSIEEQSAFFRAHLGVSGPFFEVKIGGGSSSRIKSGFHRIFYLFSYSGETSSIADEACNWDEITIDAETIDDPETRLGQFVEKFGSHYVQKIHYGFFLLVVGELSELSAEEAGNFKTELSGGFLAWKADGKISEEHVKKLEKYNERIKAFFVVGGIEPNRHRYLISFKSIAELLTGLDSGSITVLPAPLDAYALSYWQTLDPKKFPKTRKVLQNMAETEVKEPAPFGVPRGTVIAWNPPSESLVRSDDGKPILKAPHGWALCNGENGTPNLQECFIMGCVSIDKRNLQQAGAKGHSHTWKMSDAITHEGLKGNEPFATTFNTEKAFAKSVPVPKVVAANHAHNLTIDEAPNLPPHVVLAYIMKL